MAVKKLIYHDKVFDLKDVVNIDMDVSIATISKDTGIVPLNQLTITNQVTALSFSEQFKNIILADTNSSGEIFSKIPKPVPIDEIHILNPAKEKNEIQASKKQARHISLTKLLIAGVVIITLLILLLFTIPWLIFQVFRFNVSRAKNSKSKAYWSFSSAIYLLNQLGYTRRNSSALQFAMKDVDPYFNTDFSSFIQVYLKSKYSSKELSVADGNMIDHFYFPFEKTVLSKISTREYLEKFLNFYRTINYFIKSKI